MPDHRPVPLWAIIAGVLSAAMIAVWLKYGQAYIPFAAAGGLGLVLLALLIPLTNMLAARSASARSNPEQFDSLTRAISQMSEQAALSDDARRVLNRKRERE